MTSGASAKTKPELGGITMFGNHVVDGDVLTPVFDVFAFDMSRFR